MAFLKNAKLTLIKKIFVTMGFSKRFIDSLVCVFSNAWMKMSGYVANINHITQITCKFINNAMLTHNTLLKVMLQFSAHKNTGRLKVIAMLLLRSCSCLWTALTAIIIMIFDGKIYSNCVAVIGLFSLICVWVW